MCEVFLIIVLDMIWLIYYCRLFKLLLLYVLMVFILLLSKKGLINVSLFRIINICYNKDVVWVVRVVSFFEYECLWCIVKMIINR